VRFTYATRPSLDDSDAYLYVNRHLARLRMALSFEIIESARVPRLGPYSQAVRAGETDHTAYPVLNTLFAEYFPSAPPVRSAPLVQLPRGLLFSIDAVAIADA